MDTDTLIIYYEKLVKQAYEQAIEMDKASRRQLVLFYANNVFKISHTKDINKQHIGVKSKTTHTGVFLNTFLKEVSNLQIALNNLFCSCSIVAILTPFTSLLYHNRPIYALLY